MNTTKYSFRSSAVSERQFYEYAKEDLQETVNEDEDDPIWTPIISNLPPDK